ncbi:hypothetical protein [Arthrobacter sp. PsM3]|uniref:hypothetical protein n=1 Tax=Arthrobacter sp. PsM3 TaxID=3030531 RepID=UPI00263AA2CE|nr:hypothetical protein [Arthrobacter sp. PsM3]MDN4645379.1 hypothetical protein [Arthrobacter sp. PsM3]
MVELTWQDPPSRRGGTSADYDAVIEVLKENPGKWALISAEWKTTTPPSAFKQNGCEATARRNKDSKTWSVYARFPRPKTQPAPTAKVDAEKAQVRQAIQTGTALTPPPAAAPKRPAPAAEPVRPSNDMGMSQFLAARRARGVPPEGQ